ncbi:MAG TPA: outer membrane beta-barrel protein [Phnomibacter sp.]|nr:outer membrane beta-barrel protein [Phnomibacter sp.]
MTFLVSVQAMAQLGSKPIYREEREYKPYYFGLSLGYASATLHPSKSMFFLQNDSILIAEPGRSPGYSVRLLATAKLTNRFEIRANPGLILGIDRSFGYTLGSRQLFEEQYVKRNIQSNIASFPIHFKFNSDRIRNFKVYMLGGIKYDIDLASNAKSRNADDLVKLSRSDFGAEVGIGFNFCLPFVTVSPEIKFSNGFRDLHVRDANLKYSNVLDRLNSRMIFFTIHLEE